MSGDGGKQPVSELDLLAYADGLLDADPVRRDAIEREAARDRGLKQRLDAYRAQSAALRAAYDHRAHEAVPAHLMDIIDRPSRLSRTSRATAAAAAVLGLMVFAGLAGWSLGRDGSSQRSAAFIERSYDNFVALPQAVRPAALPEAEPFNWLSRKLSLTLRAPDLTAQGYDIIDTRTVRDGARDDMLRITYAGENGRNFSLFLYPRWQKDSFSIQMVREGDVSLAYWLEGPLASVIASRLPPGEILAISEAVRRSLNDPEATKPELGPAPAPDGKIAGGPVHPEIGPGIIPEGMTQGAPVLRDVRSN